LCQSFVLVNGFVTLQDHALITTAEPPTVTETPPLKESISVEPIINSSKSPSSSQFGISLIVVILVIIAAVFAWLWRETLLARLLPDGIKARYGLVADDPLK